MPLEIASFLVHERMKINLVLMIGQVENAEVRKRKYGNRSTEVRRKAAYQFPHFSVFHLPLVIADSCVFLAASHHRCAEKGPLSGEHFPRTP